MSRLLGRVPHCGERVLRIFAPFAVSFHGAWLFPFACGRDKKWQTVTNRGESCRIPHGASVPLTLPIQSRR